MYSKAKILGHPIHPALVAFPIALYVGTTVAAIAFQATADAFWFRLACYASLAAVVMGAIAAIPGLIDLLSIPGGTRARQTGITHAALNVVTLALFVVATVLLWRRWQAWPDLALDARLPIMLAVVGCATLIAAGVFGWKLVQTHHVGVLDEVEPDVPRATRPPRTTLPGHADVREPHPRTR